MPRPIGPKGAKLSALSLRLTPRTRFGLTLLARVNRRSMADVVEAALENLFYGEGPGTLERRVSGSKGKRVPVVDETWDERPWVRLGKLAILAPELLTDLELALWERISNSAKYWTKGKAVHDLERLADHMRHEELAEDWPQLCLESQPGV